MDRRFQAAQLAAAGASGGEVEELSRYSENVFTQVSEVAVPLADEPFAECWAGWVEESRRLGAAAVLGKYVPQLWFPIREGISRSEAYRAATLRGAAVDELPQATGLGLERPELVELDLYPSFAGRIPVLRVRGRQEFVQLVQALAKRNEPVAVSPAQGAAMVSGYNNWERIRQLRRAWEERHPAARGAAGWSEEFARIRQRPELYQDRFILLSDQPYSAVLAAALGLPEPEWREISLRIRREHECAHYFTRRVYGSMRNHLLDELIADYTGIVAAVGRYRADWSLRFFGLEDFPRYRPGSRLELYRGDPPLSDRAFRVLHVLIEAAVRHLEAFDAEAWPQQAPRSLLDRVLMIQVLASLTLVELASAEAADRLARTLEDCRGRTFERPPDAAS